jgi:hypothetical protein
LFEYELVKVIRNSATIKYTERVYKPGAETFEHFKETEETQLMPYPVTCLDESHEIWSKALGHTNAVAYVEKQKIQAMVTESIEILDDDEFDLSDIENLYANEGKGPHLLEMDFLPDTEPSMPYAKKMVMPLNIGIGLTNSQNILVNDLNQLPASPLTRVSYQNTWSH